MPFWRRRREPEEAKPPPPPTPVNRSGESTIGLLELLGSVSVLGIVE